MSRDSKAATEGTILSDQIDPSAAVCAARLRVYHQLLQGTTADIETNGLVGLIVSPKHEALCEFHGGVKVREADAPGVDFPIRSRD